MVQRTAASPHESFTRNEEPYTHRDTITAGADSPYERLTPNNSALLLIDYQIAPLWDIEFGDTRRAVAMLARSAHECRVPTIVTAIAPHTWGGVIPEITEVVGDANSIVRAEVNAWDNASVREAIANTACKKLIVAAGAATVAVSLCALSAANAGYDVYAPMDASAQFSHAAITTLSRAGVIVTTTQLVIAELAPSQLRTRSRYRAP